MSKKTKKTFELIIERLVPMTAVYYAEGISEEEVLKDLNEFFENIGEQHADILQIKEVQDLPEEIKEEFDSKDTEENLGDNVVDINKNKTLH